MQNRLEILDGLLHHTAEQHFFELVDAPMLSCGIELLMRNTEKVSQLFGVIEPEKMRESQHHEPFEGDAIALAKLLVKDGDKPDKFLRPHGMIRRFDGLCIFMEDYP
jgi:hypothetical protein